MLTDNFYHEIVRKTVVGFGTHCSTIYMLFEKTAKVK